MSYDYLPGELQASYWLQNGALQLENQAPASPALGFQEKRNRLQGKLVYTNGCIRRVWTSFCVMFIAAD